MNLNELAGLLPGYDELCPRGGRAVVDGVEIALVGALRRGSGVTLYALHYDADAVEAEREAEERALWEPEPAPEEEPRTNRQAICRAEEPGFRTPLMDAREASWGTGRVRFTGGGSTRLGEASWEQTLLLAEFLRAGWRPAGEIRLRELSHLCLTWMECEGEFDAVPFGAELDFTLSDQYHTHTLEEPLRLDLRAGERYPEPFSFRDAVGTQRQFYVNKLILSDIWTELERVAEKARQTPGVDVEALRRSQEEVFRRLEGDCPRGMRLPVVEYESEIQLNIYHPAFLDAAPAHRDGDCLVRSRPDEKIGPHGLRLWHSVLQDSPVPPETERMEAELLQYVERRAGGTVRMA
ncbi:hypothetical protein CE91St41_15960 [Oscillospiraceae bacterium]|nr:hypothetical protein CE91St40_21580 [Oscillospiraceae bacterium]BDF74707.1 hypothetical protein CE91St41_15960 [Oscillospiraceae bacterium]